MRFGALIFHLTSPVFSWTLPLNPSERRCLLHVGSPRHVVCVISMGLGVGVSKGLLAHHYYLLTKSTRKLFVSRTWTRLSTALAFGHWVFNKNMPISSMIEK